MAASCISGGADLHLFFRHWGDAPFVRVRWRAGLNLNLGRRGDRGRTGERATGRGGQQVGLAQVHRLEVAQGGGGWRTGQGGGSGSMPPGAPSGAARSAHTGHNAAAQQLPPWGRAGLCASALGEGVRLAISRWTASKLSRLLASSVSLGTLQIGPSCPPDAGEGRTDDMAHSRTWENHRQLWSRGRRHESSRTWERRE